MGNSMGGGKPFGPSAMAVLDKAMPERPPKMEEIATFAAGCFWSVELAFQRVPGILSTAVGYTDGQVVDPTYRQVCSGTTGHTEAVELKFDPTMVSFKELLTVLFDRMDPTSKNRQGGDVGTQYRSGIYFHSDEQAKVAKEFIDEEQKKYSAQIAVELKPASTFYMAEDYHQKYLEKGGQCSRKGDRTAIRCYG
ncbi:unnamed protein product [Chrysoparadoxa australica]